MISLVVGIGVGLGLLVAAARASVGTLPQRAALGPGLSRRFDGIFREECPGIPVEFLRALAKNESSFNPSDTQDPAWGLLQVVEVVRRDYNKANGTLHTRHDLLDPGINSRIACSLLSRIARRYRERHPRTFAHTDWRRRRFIELLVFGWNSGYSEAAGVGYVVGQLEQQGLPAHEITIDRVHQAAFDLPRASRHLRNPGRVRWCKKVARDYFRELARMRASV